MGIVWLVSAIVASYLLGSIPTAYIYVKTMRGLDIREYGSHNPGATNVARVMGKRHGTVVMLVDLLKGFLAVKFLSQAAAAGIPSPSAGVWAPVLVGFLAIAGHNWSVWLHFRGGRGVATSAGVFLALHWQALLVALVVFSVVLLFTRTVSIASIASAVALPISMYMFGADNAVKTFAIVAAVLLIARHKENITRLVRGEEKSFKKSE